MQNKITLINIFTPKVGKGEEFARKQIHDYEEFGKELDGRIQNRFYISVNEKNRPKLINVAEFESLEVFYRTTQSEIFKKHIQGIQPLLDGGEPMLCQLLWQSTEPSMNDIDRVLGELYPKQVEENQKLSEELGARKLRKTA